MADSPQELIDLAVERRERALTPEQRAWRAEVAARTEIISRGVKPPPSGIFGNPAEKPPRSSAR